MAKSLPTDVYLAFSFFNGILVSDFSYEAFKTTRQTIVRKFAQQIPFSMEPL